MIRDKVQVHVSRHSTHIQDAKASPALRNLEMTDQDFTEAIWNTLEDLFKLMSI